MKLGLVAALSVLLITAGAASADEAGDRASVRAVIDAQISAFRSDDGATAYSLATPRLREIFPSVDVFMSMVKSGYAPVYRPKSVTFGRVQDIPGGFAQEVFVVGPDGDPYTALYTLEKQPDGSLRISGCRIIKSSGESA